MYAKSQLVERSIALWKAQNGPIRKTIGKHLKADIAIDAAPRHPCFIDYTRRDCHYS